MIERRVFFQEVLILLFLSSLLFNNLPLVELLPQHNEQFAVYNVPEHPAQFSAIPEDRGLQIPLDNNAVDNFNKYGNQNVGEEILQPVAVASPAPVAVASPAPATLPRGHTLYSSSLSEEYDTSVGIEEQDGEAIPGEAQQDYPIYEEIPRTRFSCRGKYAPAYYADVEARCQVFHICDVGGHKHSFLCPNGSVFNQKYLVCDWWYDFSCDNAETLFNKQIVPTEINSVSPIITVSPNNIESDKTFLNNNNGVTPQNEYNNYQNGNNNGFVYNHEANRNGFEFPNTQIDIPQQIYTDNVYIPQNDIFHGAETGFPGRDFITQNSGNFSDSNILKDNTANNSAKTNIEKHDDYNLQQNTQNDVNNDKKVSKTNNENVLQSNTNYNVNDNGNRKQSRAGRKGTDLTVPNRNTAAGNNKEQINFQNNIEEVNLNRQGDSRSNAVFNNNQNSNFQPFYNNGQIPLNNLQFNENQEINKPLVHQSTQQQLNFVHPLV